MKLLLIIITTLLIFLLLLFSVILPFSIDFPYSPYKKDYFTISQRIPRIIHQTYSKSKLTPDLKRAMKILREDNPNYTYKFYDDNDIIQYIQRYFPKHILDSYLRINPIYGAARADLFRYLVIYNEGGVYLDIKSGPTQPLDKIIHPEDRLILSHWGYDNPWYDILDIKEGELVNWFIIAEPGHPTILKAIENVLYNIDNYDKNAHTDRRIDVLFTTGPIAFTRAVYGDREQPGVRFVKDISDLDLEYSVIKDHYQGKSYTLDEPIII